jgi:transcriptional regulator with XRE-family HTH domain
MGKRKTLTDIRLDAGLSQAALAEKLRVAPSRVSEWERGIRYPSLSTAISIAKALGVELGELARALDATQVKIPA